MLSLFKKRKQSKYFMEWQGDQESDSQSHVVEPQSTSAPTEDLVEDLVSEPTATPAVQAETSQATPKPAQPPAKPEIQAAPEPALTSTSLAQSPDQNDAAAATTFAPDYLVPGLIPQARRQAGPNLGAYKDMARQMR